MAIAKRLGVTPGTVQDWHKRRHFLMFLRRGKGHRNRNIWYTNDALILIWEIRQCDKDRGRRQWSRARRPVVRDAVEAMDASRRTEASGHTSGVDITMTRPDPQ